VALTLSADPTAAGFGRFLALFVPIGWAWAGFTFYATRFDTDDLVYRLLTLLGMFAVAALASSVPDALHGGQNRFVIAYVAVRAILLVLYGRAYRHVERPRPLARWFILMFGIAVCDWLISLALPVPWKYAMWGIALAFEHAAPIRAWRLVRNATVHPRHIPERYGLLIIIVLGEAVIGVVLGTATVSWTTLSGLAAFGGFVAPATTTSAGSQPPGPACAWSASRRSSLPLRPRSSTSTSCCALRLRRSQARSSGSPNSSLRCSSSGSSRRR
jgi:low temperature requirement protein LtrA